ncbi:P-loop containing nucleoside triphosphate hydrolase protein, partial [Immersiella caudata]
ILCLGLFRTGTYSMTKALHILGYTHILHGLDIRAGLAGLNPTTQEPWSRAAWANLPFLHQFVPEIKSFSRREWDGTCALGTYHAVTDTASLYAAQLIKAYPGAKVILCYRDPVAWAASVDDTFVKVVTSRGGILVRRWAEPLLGGSYPITQLWDVLRGWFEVETLEEMRGVYLVRYERHYEMVRRLVPREQLLECRLGEGWGPMCEFLGRPVPGVEYPRVNE